MYKRLKFISFQCALDVSVISVFFLFFFLENEGKFKYALKRDEL